MATGDTIGGAVQVVREDTQGNRTIVMGSVPQDKVDYFNNSVSAEEKLYVNTGRSDRVGKPAGAESHDAPDAVFESGEKLIVQHQASSTVTNDIDLDADSFTISGVSVDKNRGNAFTQTLTQADQELSGTAAEDDTGWVDMYEFTVGDRRRFHMAGEFEAVAVES